MGTENKSWIGRTFDQWTVLDSGAYYNTGKKSKGFKYECVCKCGTVRLVYKNDLIIGRSRSCGCMARKNCGWKLKEMK